MNPKHRLQVFAPRGLRLIVILAALGCGSEPEVVQRLSSPDGSMDAVLLRYSGAGPTVGSTFSGHIVPEGDVPSENNVIFNAERVRGTGIDFRWVEPDLLVVHYDTARIGQFQNEWWNGKTGSERRTVEIRLVPRS